MWWVCKQASDVLGASPRRRHLLCPYPCLDHCVGRVIRPTVWAGLCYHAAGPAPILSDPVHPTIPYGYIPKSSPAYPCARPDKRLNSCDGSELFIVDVWSLDQSSPV